MTQSRDVILSQDHISKMKVTVITLAKFLSVLFFVYAIVDMDDISHNEQRVYHDCSAPNQNQGSDDSSFMPCWTRTIFHTAIVLGRRLYHDLEPRSYLEDQGQSAHLARKPCLTIPPYVRSG